MKPNAVPQQRKADTNQNSIPEHGIPRKREESEKISQRKPGVGGGAEGVCVEIIIK